MNNYRIVTKLCLLFLYLFSNMAYSDLDFSIDPIEWSSSLSTPYDFTDKNPYRMPITVQLYSSETVPYFYFITFSMNKTTDYHDSVIIEGALRNSEEEQSIIKENRSAVVNNTPIFYQFYKTKSSTIPLSETIESDYAMIRNAVTIQNSPVIKETFYMEVFPNQQIPKGIYKDIAIVSLYKGPTEFFSDSTLVARKKIPVSIPVLSVSKIDFFEVNKNLSYDLKDLISQQKRSIQFKFSSNEQASLFLHVDHGSLSYTDTHIIYHPSETFIKPQKKQLTLEPFLNKQSLQTLDIIIDPLFYTHHNSTLLQSFVTTSNTKEKTIIHKTIQDNGSTTTNAQTLPFIQDTFRIIVQPH